MKTLLKLTVVLFLTLNFGLSIISAQTPESFKYQAVIRDGSGNVLVNQTVGLQFSILQNTTAVYTETFTDTTNEFGLINLNIGEGTVVSGEFSTIDWSTDTYFLKVEIDETGGTNYTQLSTSKLNSVPYALHARTAENTDDADADPTNELQILNFSNDTLYLSGGGQIYLGTYGNLWATHGNDIYNTNSQNVGVGLENPTGKLVVQGDTAVSDTLPLFEVKNKDGITVFAVYDGGVRVYVNDDPAKSNNDKSGFAIGGYRLDKSVTNEYLRVTPDSVRVYIKDETDPSKANNDKGGFAIGGYRLDKSTTDYLLNVYSGDTSYIINPSEARIMWYPAKEAFMAGRVLVESEDSVGVNSWATGYESKSIGNFSQALGYKARAFGNNSTAIGYYANADSANSYAFGNAAQTNNLNSYALGNTAIANGASSFAMGTGSQADGDYSVAFGFNTISNNYYSTALGYMSEANDTAATSMGYQCKANTPYSFTGGYQAKTNIANGTSAIEGNGAIAVGYKSEAKGNGAIAMGYESKANYPYSSAIGGYQCEANAWGSTALGDACKTYAKHSFASGYHSKTYGDYSIASGAELISNSFCEAVFGRFNDTLDNASRIGYRGTDPLFVIGNGTDDIYRNNAFTILKNGDMILAKDTFDGEFLRFRTSGVQYDIDFTEHNLYFSGYVNNVQRYILVMDHATGYVGIGKEYPDYPLHVAGSVNKTFNYGYLNSGGVTGTSAVGGEISIYAEHRIRAEEFNADSDIRIKNVKGVSNSKKDLELLKKVKITDYQYIDTIGKGTKEYKKVIAQELQKVLPNAVTTTKGYIPNIYSKALSVNYDEKTTTLNIETAKANNLKVGDKVKLIHKNGELTAKVTSIISDKIFTVKSDKEYSDLFVFGKEVKDFLTVDYEAISMLNVSATQQLIKNNEKLKSEIEKLKQENIQFKLKLSEINNLKAELEQIKQILEVKAQK